MVGFMNLSGYYFCLAIRLFNIFFFISPCMYIYHLDITINDFVHVDFVIFILLACKKLIRGQRISIYIIHTLLYVSQLLSETQIQTLQNKLTLIFYKLLSMFTYFIYIN